MWQYQKFLEYPVKIKTPNPKLANFIVSQYGGPNGELGASMRYLSQRFSMPDDRVKAALTDIGTGVPKMFPAGEQFSADTRGPLEGTGVSQVGKNAVSSPFCSDFSASSAADLPKKLNFCGRHFKYTSMCSRSYTTMRSRISR